MVRNLDIDLFIFSCDGVDAAGNIWDTDNGNTLFKKFMLKKSLHSILLVDSSKMERSSEVMIGNVSAVTTVIRQ
jgi:DeoR family L-fucose operon activator